MTVASKLAGMREEVRRPGVSMSDKVVRVTQRALWSTGLSPHLSVLRCKIVETRQPPKTFRGLSDLVVRAATERDVPGMCAVANGDANTFRARLANGDFGFIGELEGEILCYTWFHRGPSPFDEERLLFAPWGLDASAFWSYDAMSRVEARSSGVFVKVFQTALREIFATHGARRVQGFIHLWNDASLTVHRRLGFDVLGDLTCVALPGVKWLHWAGPASTRQWLLRRSSDVALRFPPA